MLAQRIILFFRRSLCSLAKTSLLQNHSILAEDTIVFFRRSRCYSHLTKTSLLQNHAILAQNTIVLQNHSILAHRTILFFRRSRRYPLWHKQPCCRTILVSRTEQAYCFANHDAIPCDKNNPAAEPF